jgi:hypothetical protein
MTDKTIIIHAGWNKTATTFLQREVFIPSFGKGLIGPNIRLNDLQVNSYTEKPLLISDESLLGVTIFTRNKCRITQRLNFLKNWAKIAPNTKFILGVRRHDQFIESLYRQYLQVGGDLKAEEFIDIYNNKGFVKVDELLYEPILSCVYELFPEEEHFIYDYNLFKDDTTKFLTDLLPFVEIENFKFGKTKIQSTKNRSIGYQSGSILRVINKFVSSPLQPNKPVSISLFKLIALGKSPRQLLQSIPERKSSQKFTQKIFDAFQSKFHNDWLSITEKYSVRTFEGK